MRTVAILALAACGSDPAGGSPDGGTSGDGGSLVDAPPGALDPGTMDVAWMHGSANCNDNADPELQAHAYNATTFIFRQNKCDTFEAPFLYLLVGETHALLVDTGAVNSSAVPTAVTERIGARALIVAHTHAHGDHISGDSRFTSRANTMVVAPTLAAVQSAFGIDPWPGDAGLVELGDRTIDVIGLPGHEASHVAFYDRRTGLLLTGDSLYPGYLFVDQWAAYRESIARLADFVGTRPVVHVLGAHVEMTATPRMPYPYGETYQPAEHVLELAASHVVALDAALSQLGATPPAEAVRYDDFVIVPP